MAHTENGSTRFKQYVKYMYFTVMNDLLWIFVISKNKYSKNYVMTRFVEYERSLGSWL